MVDPEAVLCYPVTNLEDSEPMAEAMRVFTIFLISLAIAPASFSQESGEEQTPQEEVDTVRVEETVSYAADTVEYLPGEGKVLLRGNAKVNYKDIVVDADLIEFESESKEIFAEGSPVLISSGDTLYGQRMGYHLDTKRGFVENGRTRMEKGWFTGDLIRLAGERTLNIDWGTFTTCDHNPPHYYFISRRLKVYANDMVVCEPIVLVVRTLPILAVPFWFFPIKKERHSGFLIPKVGRSAVEGKYVQNIAYYWVINDYSDLTVGFDYLEKKGLRSQAEALYLVKPFLSGRVTGSFIDELDTGKKRWNLNANHLQTLPFGVSLLGHADFLSDATYAVDYEEERIVQLNKQLDSYLSLSRVWSGAIAQIVLNQNKDLQTGVTSEMLPKASFSLSSRRIFSPKAEELPKWFHSIYLTYRGTAVNSREKSEEGLELHQGFDNLLTLNSPQRIFRYFNLSPAVSFRETIYKRDGLGEKYPRREHYQASVGLSTVIYGLSRWGIGPVKRFRHVLKPSLSYSYAPEVDQSRYDDIPGMAVSSANNLLLTLGNEFQVKLGRGEEVRRLDLATLSLSAGYDLEERTLSNVQATLDMNPVRLVDFRLTGFYNPYTRTLETINATTAIGLRGSGQEEGEQPWSLNLNHNYIWGVLKEKDTHQLWGDVGFSLTRNWRVNYGMRYDLTGRTIVDRSFSLQRNLHCWEAYFTWSTYGDKWEYDFKINIKAVPEIRLGKGILGIFIR